jgi:hypothetical protein
MRQTDGQFYKHETRVDSYLQPVCRAGQCQGASLLLPSCALCDSLLRALEREEREGGRERERTWSE